MQQQDLKSTVAMNVLLNMMRGKSSEITEEEVADVVKVAFIAGEKFVERYQEDNSQDTNLEFVEND